MNLILHAGHQSAPIVGEIREVDTDMAFAQIVDASVGSDADDWLDACAGAKRVVVRCADPIHADASVSDDERLLASWSQAGWAQFDEDLAMLDQQAIAAGIELMIRPSCEGMLSDAICTMAWARRAQGLGCTLLLDPVGWLTGSMMRDVDDHLRRFGELCQSCSKIGAVLVRSVRTDAAGKLEEVRVGEGELDPKLIMDRLGRVIRDADAVVVLDWMDLDLLGL